jgi:Ca2+-binding RTX toxin-like protein
VNLHLSLAANPQPRSPGDAFAYVVTLVNNGGGTDSTTLTVSLPGQVSYASAKVDRGPGCSAAGQTITCPLDFFPAGAASTVLINVQVTAAAALIASASVVSSPGDADPGDDVATLTLQLGAVSPPPAPVTPPPSRNAAPARSTTSTRGITRTGTAGADRLTGTSRDDILNGLAGNDSLNGKAGHDRLEGGRGNDRLTGGLGADRIDAGPGNDTVDAGDGSRDVITCGPGPDTVYADRADSIGKSCEAVHRR